MTRAEELAEAHWQYIKGILLVHDVTPAEIVECGYHYKTAFVHGYKHAIEDVTEDKRIFSESGGLGEK
jgi:hypothetical protein